MHHRRSRRLACAASGAVVAGLLGLAACGGSDRPAAPALSPSSTIDHSASLTALQTQFEAILAAEGKSISRLASAAPTGTDNLVFDLSLRVVDSSGNPVAPGSAHASQLRLEWTERLAGDYDQNGEVNLADLVPLSQQFRQLVAYDEPALHGGFAGWPAGAPDAAPPGSAFNNWRLARIDGDANGEINGADLRPIAEHWGERLDGYLIERGVNRGNGGIEWSALPVNAGFGRAPSAPRPAQAAGGPVRYSLLASLDEPGFEQVYRVRAWNAAHGPADAASNTATYLPSLTADNVPPVWDSVVGAQQLVPANNQLTVHFDGAGDAQSPPVTYRVYWQAGATEDGAPFDYAAAQWADSAGGAYTIGQLDNAQHYRVAVRARDSAVPANEEQNTVVLGRQPGPRDIYPPHWAGDYTGIANLFYGNGEAVVSWEEAFDYNADTFGVWSSGPPNYRLYYGPGTAPDYATATVIKIASNGEPAYVRPISGIDTSRPHWFSVRAVDRAEFPNTELNTNFKVGWPSQTALVAGGMPGAGPAVVEPQHVFSQPWFAYSAARDAARLCIESYTANERWLSVYRVDAAAVTHEADYNFASIAANPQFKLQAVGLDAQLAPRLTYTRSREFRGAHVLVEYSAAAGQTVEYTIDSGPDLMSAEYGPDGKLHGFWLEMTEPDLLDLQFATYYSGLPYVQDRLVFSSAADPGDGYLEVKAGSWSWLAGGAVAVLGEMVSLVAPEREARLVTIGADGAPLIGPPPFAWVEATGNLRLSRRGTDRPVLVDWDPDYNGLQVAELRLRWQSRQFGNEPAFTQLCLSHPVLAPGLAVLDIENFAVPRVFSTTFQAGAGGLERIHRCLHCSIQGREAIVPLPQLAADEAVFPLELLPGGLLISRTQNGNGQRLLITDLAAD